MVNSIDLRSLTSLVSAYVAMSAATVAALVVLSIAGSHQATDHAWGHAVVVLVFAVVLPLRLRAARAGRRSGLRAVGIIGAVVLIVNVIEAQLSDYFPLWLRIEMFAVVALMAVLVLCVVRIAIARPAAARH